MNLEHVCCMFWHGDMFGALSAFLESHSRTHKAACYSLDKGSKSFQGLQRLGRAEEGPKGEGLPCLKRLEAPFRDPLFKLLPVSNLCFKQTHHIPLCKPLLPKTTASVPITGSFENSGWGFTHSTQLF